MLILINREADHEADAPLVGLMINIRMGIYLLVVIPPYPPLPIADACGTLSTHLLHRPGE
jgi:hypothetical protein